MGLFIGLNTIDTVAQHIGVNIWRSLSAASHAYLAPPSMHAAPRSLVMYTGIYSMQAAHLLLYLSGITLGLSALLRG